MRPERSDQPVNGIRSSKAPYCSLRRPDVRQVGDCPGARVAGCSLRGAESLIWSDNEGKHHG